jgi:hypothetical protein
MVATAFQVAISGLSSFHIEQNPVLARQLPPLNALFVSRVKIHRSFWQLQPNPDATSLMIGCSKRR